jgi:hypothetical protein
MKGKLGVNTDEKAKYLKEYRWSSYPDYIFPKRREDFLKVDEVMAYFGGDKGRGRRNYKKFVEEVLAGEPANPLEKGKGHGIVGDDDFVDRIKEEFIHDSVDKREIPAIKRIMKQVAPMRIIEVVSKVVEVGKGDLLRKRKRGIERNLLMEMLYRHGGMKQREIGEILGVDYSAVSVGRKRLQAIIEKDQEVLGLMEKVHAALSQE